MTVRSAPNEMFGQLGGSVCLHRFKADFTRYFATECVVYDKVITVNFAAAQGFYDIIRSVYRAIKVVVFCDALDSIHSVIHDVIRLNRCPDEEGIKTVVSSTLHAS